MFDFAEMTKDLTANEILNYYRNLYYAEPQVTERGIVANAINDFLSEKEGEAEMLQGALKAEERHNELTMQIAQIALKNEKIEVARKIFEEIEDSMSCFEDDDDGYLLKKCEFEFFMRELKKKYMEESGNVVEC